MILRLECVNKYVMNVSKLSPSLRGSSLTLGMHIIVRARTRDLFRLREILKQKPAVYRFAPQLTDSVPSKVCIETRMLRLHSVAAVLIPRGTSYNLGLIHFAADDADESTNRATTTCSMIRIEDTHLSSDRDWVNRAKTIQK